jgi:hypothetical protein
VADVGGQERGGGAGAAAEVGDDPLVREQRQERGEPEVVAEHLAAQRVPVAGHASKEGVRVGVAGGEDALEALPVLVGEGGLFGVVAQEGPERAGLVGEVAGEAQEGGGALVAALDPAGGVEGLEVSADGGLGELEEARELSDAELLLLQEAQEADAGGVAQEGEVIVEADLRHCTPPRRAAVRGAAQPSAPRRPRQRSKKRGPGGRCPPEDLKNGGRCPPEQLKPSQQTT